METPCCCASVVQLISNKLLAELTSLPLRSIFLHILSETIIWIRSYVQGHRMSTRGMTIVVFALDLEIHSFHTKHKWHPFTSYYLSHWTRWSGEFYNFFPWCLIIWWISSIHKPAIKRKWPLLRCLCHQARLGLEQALCIIVLYRKCFKSWRTLEAFVTTQRIFLSIQLLFQIQTLFVTYTIKHAVKCYKINK